MRTTAAPARRLLAGALALSLTVAAAACGSSDGDDAAPSSTTAADGTATTAPPPDAAAFPVTIDHARGTTTVEEAPERVAAVGLTDQDALIALGVLPVLTVEWFGDRPGAIFPWAAEEAAALGDVDDITVLQPDAGLSAEPVAATRPDLIVGLYSGLTEDQYDALSKIAPTVAQPVGPDYGISWQDQTRTIGQLVGRSERAEELIAETEAAIAAVREAHPELEGKTAIVATPYEGIYVYGRNDPRGRILEDLGMVLPDELDEVAGGAGYGKLSLERADLLDVDVVIWLDPDDAEGELGGPIYQQLGMADQGREVMLSGYAEDGFGAAMSFQSVLSLPFLLEQLAPMLSAAADGDPDTKVPTPKGSAPR